jgi:putative ABC transport system permease protein
VDVVLPAESGGEGRRVHLRELVAELGALPGVQSAAAVQRLPLRSGGDNWGLSIEGRPEVTGVTTSFRIVTHDYLPTLGVRLRSGRLFEPTDAAGTERVAVINESLAREYFPGEDPIGRRVGDDDWARVIGVVADMKESALTDDPHPARYVLYDQIDYTPTSNALVLRMRDGRDATAVLEPARRAIQRTAPAVGIQDATTMARVLDHALGPAKQLMSLLTLLSGLALLLGGVGVYGVVSHFVSRRRRDWGIRLALGFRPAQIIGHVVGRGALLILLGIGAGVIGALGLGRLLGAFVYGIETGDPAALAAAAAALFLIGVIGAYVPAWRASRVDPARVLREQ